MSEFHDYLDQMSKDFIVPIKELLNNKSKKNISNNQFLISDCKAFSTIVSEIPNSVTFAKNKKFLRKALKNKNISFILCSQELIDDFESSKLVPVKNAEETFISLRKNYLELKNNSNFFPESYFSPGSKILNKKNISMKGVFIGKNFEAGNARINTGTLIGNNVNIKNNVIIGSEDLMVARDSANTESRHIIHDGLTIVDDQCIIYDGSKISKGIFGWNTHLHMNCEVGLNCVIGHGVIINKNTTICSGSMIGGFSSIGHSSYLGLGSTVINRISLSSNTKLAAGAVVFKSVSRDNVTLIGNPARKFKVND